MAAKEAAHDEIDQKIDVEKSQLENGDMESKSIESEDSSEETQPTTQEQVDDLQDKLLRLHAEMDNLRKRSAREISDARKFAVERFAISLLDVVDNLERALDVEEGNEQALRDGVKLTLDSWKGLMERFELERFDAVGEIFDAHRHEALSQMPSEEPKETIIAQHVAGYTLHGRLIRPAKVLVSAGNG
ncbi:MAG: nucleotide exchange factor GrpE [Mariprofundales bacterium]